MYAEFANDLQQMNNHQEKQYSQSNKKITYLDQIF